MSDRQPDPRRLDLRRIAQQAEDIAGEVPHSALPRFAASVLPLSGEPSLVHWLARGESRQVKGGVPQVWLHLQADTAVQLVCQRCLQPMMEQLRVDRSFLFVRNADDAERLDEESDDDVLVLPQLFDVVELLEDELILALPLVPRHEACPNPLPVAAFDLDNAAAAANPFAALSVLRPTPRQE